MQIDPFVLLLKAFFKLLPVNLRLSVAQNDLPAELFDSVNFQIRSLLCQVKLRLEINLRHELCKSERLNIR